MFSQVKSNQSVAKSSEEYPSRHRARKADTTFEQSAQAAIVTDHPRRGRSSNTNQKQSEEYTDSAKQQKSSRSHLRAHARPTVEANAPAHGTTSNDYL
jgi:hypothetical protein